MSVWLALPFLIIVFAFPRHRLTVIVLIALAVLTFFVEEWTSFTNIDGTASLSVYLVS